LGHSTAILAFEMHYIIYHHNSKHFLVTLGNLQDGSIKPLPPFFQQLDGKKPLQNNNTAANETFQHHSAITLLLKYNKAVILSKLFTGRFCSS